MLSEEKKRMTNNDQRGVGILWSAADETVYCFERKGPDYTTVIGHTIASYFQAAYGIRLRYNIQKLSKNAQIDDQLRSFTLTRSRACNIGS